MLYCFRPLVLLGSFYVTFFKNRVPLKHVHRGKLIVAILLYCTIASTLVSFDSLMGLLVPEDHPSEIKS